MALLVNQETTQQQVETIPQSNHVNFAGKERNIHVVDTEASAKVIDGLGMKTLKFVGNALLMFFSCIIFILAFLTC